MKISLYFLPKKKSYMIKYMLQIENFIEGIYPKIQIKKLFIKNIILIRSIKEKEPLIFIEVIYNS